jgi:CheY-like chemotaxis protein
MAMIKTIPGARLTIARTGEDGFRLACESPPDVILLDIHLPGINGFEVLRQLRADQRTASLPVVAVSASALSDDIAQGLDAGFCAWLTKPLNITRLLSLLAGVARSRPE